MKMVNTGGGHKNPNLRISPGMPRGPNNEYEKPQQHVLSLRRDLAQASHVPVWKEIWDFPRRHRDSLVLWGGHPPYHRTPIAPLFGWGDFLGHTPVPFSLWVFASRSEFQWGQTE